MQISNYNELIERLEYLQDYAIKAARMETITHQEDALMDIHDSLSTIVFRLKETGHE